MFLIEFLDTRGETALEQELCVSVAAEALAFAICLVRRRADLDGFRIRAEGRLIVEALGRPPQHIQGA